MIQLMREFTYKPGWGFSAERDGEAVKVSVRMLAKNVENPSSEISVNVSSRELVGCWNQEELVRHVVRLVSELEHHEMIEHLRFRSLRLSNPHAELRDEQLAFGYPIA